MNIVFSRQCTKQSADLPTPVQRKFQKILHFFRKDPAYPSLRLHKLSGKFEDCWSISLDQKHRAIFRWKDHGTVLFISVGTHAIYE